MTRTLLKAIESGEVNELPLAPSFDHAAFQSHIVALVETDAASAASRSSILTPRVRSILSSIASNSEYLRHLMLTYPNELCRFLDCDLAQTFEDLLAKTAALIGEQDVESLMKKARHLKCQVALLVGLADLTKFWTTQRVVEALSAFADACVDAVVAFLLQRALEARPEGSQHIDIRSSGYTVLAMGKHGAGELNYSSDIDLIVVYDPEVTLFADPGKQSQVLVRLTQTLIRILQERTGEGYVFRVDLRLRPDPSATPVAVSVPAALHYYEARGQNWERAALIKARPIAGDLKTGRSFLKDLSPFIWRRYLDFTAVADIQRIKNQISETNDVSGTGLFGKNIKLGQGGIRQIEFFAQTQQLIAAGRRPELRVMKTIDALKALSDGGWISAQACEDLTTAYWALRDVEHRLQMRSDEQIHTLPKTHEAFETIARLSGFEHLEAFQTDLQKLLSTVCRHADELFSQQTDMGNNDLWQMEGEGPNSVVSNHLAELGFHRCDDIYQILKGWQSGRYAALQTATAQRLLADLLPHLIAHLATNDDPDGAVVSFDRFLQRLPTGIQLFSLLSAKPALLSLITRIMGTAPRMADTVVARPHVLDPLLEPSFFQSLPNSGPLRQTARSLLDSAQNYEDGLDRIRVLGREQQFLIGTRVLTETVSPSEAGHSYTVLAEALLSELIPYTVKEFQRQHGCVDGQQIALLAMGRLGSREMTASSDLDLILLYDFHQDAANSDGVKPLASRQYFARLTQRIVAAITSPTAQGRLYEVDFRLRPSGNAGPLATHLDAFTQYQASEAWTWEHMALTRARPFFGDPELIEKTRDAIQSVVTTQRSWSRLRDDALDMRTRLERDRTGTNPWAVKHAAGGLVDIEFIAQALVLRHAHRYPALHKHSPLTILTTARNLDVLSANDAKFLCDACDLYQNYLQLERICLAGPTTPDSISTGYADLICRSRGLPNVEAVTGELIDTQSRVRDIFNAFFEKEEER